MLVMCQLVLVVCLFIGIQKGSSLLLEDDCGTTRDNGIHPLIDGKDADIFAHPWMVRVMILNTPQCGGSLITSRFVLTSAHCISRDYMSVRLGEYDIQHPRPICDNYGCKPRAFNVDVDMKIVHSDERYDIGLLRMNTSVTFSDYVRPICILVDAPVGPAPLFNVTGWGRNSNGEPQHRLQIATLIELPKERCRKLGKVLDESYICAGSDHSDSCEGDSGGPLSAIRRFAGQKRVFQFGVVSAGLPSCRGLAVYTNVTHFRSWILSAIQEYAYAIP
ncbi:serine protease grass [Drosophila teissieri]|uniref:serine protease grass n=1 Tax=Drosophila teissieri TaxID=7243 RepID=UPI001CBA2DB9|nr:serine protease grass [Drosophila teissieri]